MNPSKTFVQELEGLINSFCEENTSNTPDFILAQYLLNCLNAFNVASRSREDWYNCHCEPGKIVGTLYQSDKTAM